jgi:hypothetical protein
MRGESRFASIASNGRALGAVQARQDTHRSYIVHYQREHSFAFKAGNALHTGAIIGEAIRIHLITAYDTIIVAERLRDDDVS